MYLFNFLLQMLKDFKNFLMKGNVVDLAVAFIIGGAFKTIVTSLVNDIIMPAVGVLVGGVDFKDLKFVLKAAEGEVAAVTLNYGAFVQTIVDFVIIGAAIFVFVKAYEKLQAKKEEAPAAPAGPTTEELLEKILKEMKKK
ncbi:large conductance mechanosensitive channel protein MscL [bacterium DOLZORAL124_38_8]|nr:MAG: large conductance mechanosensitive channel protein MscL [bacterium DOLZORAL124_38_8]